MLARLAGNVADLPTLPQGDFITGLVSDDARVTRTCAVARQPTLSPTSRRRVGDGDDDAELVWRAFNQLADGRDEVSRRDALRYTPTNDAVLSLPLVTVALGDENERWKLPLVRPCRFCATQSTTVI